MQGFRARPSRPSVLSVRPKPKEQDSLPTRPGRVHRCPGESRRHALLPLHEHTDVVGPVCNRGRRATREAGGLGWAHGASESHGHRTEAETRTAASSRACVCSCPPSGVTGPCRWPKSTTPSPSPHARPLPRPALNTKPLSPRPECQDRRQPASVPCGRRSTQTSQSRAPPRLCCALPTDTPKKPWLGLPLTPSAPNRLAGASLCDPSVPVRPRASSSSLWPAYCAVLLAPGTLSVIFKLSSMALTTLPPILVRL